MGFKALLQPPVFSRYSPGSMPAATLERMFVKREPVARRLVANVVASVQGASKHHMLVVAPVGSGKTHLLTLVYHRLRADPALAAKMVVARLEEDAWGVDSYVDLLVRILQALAHDEPDPQLDARLAALLATPAGQVQRAAEDLLHQAVGERTLVLMVENLDRVFEALGEEGRRRLRALLQERPFCTTVASAPSLFDGVQRRAAVFYGFFEIMTLQGFDVTEAQVLLGRLALMTERTRLSEFLDTSSGRARIRAVQHLAGGNPRFLVTLGDSLTRKGLDALVPAMMRTLDELTPYYQAQLARLSGQQRKLVEILCDAGGALVVKDIAARAFVTSQTASSQLRKLLEADLLVATSCGRETYYELREPLVRLALSAKRPSQGPPEELLRRLRAWYALAEGEAVPGADALLAPVHQAAQQFSATGDIRILMRMPLEERRLITEPLEANAPLVLP